MKLIKFFKNLFKRNTQEQEKQTSIPSGYHDIFGNIIMNDEIVHPVLYNDVKRRGYFTVNAKTHGYLPNELTSSQLKNGLLKRKDLISASLCGKMKMGRRVGFYHYTCTVDELNIA